jgi:hypothetical protein
VQRPDGSTFVSWTGTSPSTYNASYWYWSYALPANAATGTWVFSTVFNGVTDTVGFSVNPKIPTAVLNLSGNQYIKLYPNPSRASDALRIDWQLNGVTSQMMSVRVFDLNGKMIGNTRRVRRLGEVVMPETAGTYIIEVVVNEKEVYRLQVVRH